MLNPKNWENFVPDSRETGEPESVRWARREVMHDPDWSKWHATDGRASHTACNRLIMPFLVDGSPQFGELERVNCKRCRAALEKRKPERTRF